MYHPTSRLHSEAFVSDLIPTTTQLKFKERAAIYTWILLQASPPLKHYRHVLVILHASVAFYLVTITIQHCTVVLISMSVTIVRVRRTLTALIPMAPMNAYHKKALETTLDAKPWKGPLLSSTTISLYLTASIRTIMWICRFSTPKPLIIESSSVFNQLRTWAHQIRNGTLWLVAESRVWSEGFSLSVLQKLAGMHVEISMPLSMLQNLPG